MLSRKLIFALLFSAFATTVMALPEYQVLYQQTCGLCHVNPSGGGMRTLYGAQFFSYKELPVNNRSFEEIGKFDPAISDNLQIGMDFRQLFYALDNFETEEENSTNHNQFINMQADVYLAYMMNDKTNVVIDVSNNGIEEAFATFYSLPLTGVIKTGKFMPSYGWRFADHRQYVRQFLGYGSPAGSGINSYDTGLELGFYPESWDFTFGLFNGETGGKGKSFLYRMAKRVSFNSLNLSLGGSYRLHDLGGTSADWHGGLFYGLNFRKFTYLGETNLISGPLDGLVTSNQLRYAIKRGIYTNLYYEFFDPDLDLRSGYHWRVRLSTDYVPHGYIAISPAIHWNHDLDEKEYGIGEIQLHLWF